MDALFVFVAPIVALKINVKVDWSLCNFSQNFNIRINDGFSCIDVSLVPWGILKAEGDRSGGYRGIFDQSIVHGRVVDVCCPANCCARTSASTGQAKDDNARIHLAESANFIGTMLCALTGHCVHQTSLQLSMCRTFWAEGSMHNIGYNNPPPCS